MDELLGLLTPADVEATLARRIRAARRARRWTQAELARRSLVSVATVARLEQSGQGQISSLVRVVSALGRLDDFDAVLRAPPPATMAELREREGGR
jgi:transcriptional regulator with XRE-family HTH domain